MIYSKRRNFKNIYSFQVELATEDRLYFAVNSVLGSVTNYGTKMEDVHCSPKQHMVVKSANYGDFNENGVFHDVKNTATKCNALTNCQVKYLCGGERSCELTIDNKLLQSPDCSDTSKEIYIKYTCVDSNNSTIITTGGYSEIYRLNIQPRCILD